MGSIFLRRNYIPFPIVYYKIVRSCQFENKQYNKNIRYLKRHQVNTKTSEIQQQKNQVNIKKRYNCLFLEGDFNYEI